MDMYVDDLLIQQKESSSSQQSEDYTALPPNQLLFIHSLDHIQNNDHRVWNLLKSLVIFKLSIFLVFFRCCELIIHLHSIDCRII